MSVPGPLLIFGGTFDPPQRAHVDVPRAVAQHLHCDRILYVPTSINPFKTDHPPAPPEDRLAMLRLALRRMLATPTGADPAEGTAPVAIIDTIELDRPPPAYTVDTLAALRRRFGPAQRFRLLMGSDAARSFPSWRDPAGILAIARPAVVVRPPDTRAALESTFRRLHGPLDADTWIRCIVDAPLIETSATAVRERLRRGEAVGDALDPEVERYIRAHGLYVPERPAGSGT
ncbi:MAG: nicotinate (nicotinamide) nucleotide adenylyltransferase [Phycisphaerales bacterium]